MLRLIATFLGIALILVGLGAGWADVRSEQKQAAIRITNLEDDRQEVQDSLKRIEIRQERIATILEEMKD